MKFPNPIYFGNRRHWPLSSLRRYEAAVAGLPPPDPLDPADERFLTAPQVRQRYQVSDMWIHRRLAEHAAPEGSAA